MNRTHIPGVNPMDFRAKPLTFETGYDRPYYVTAAPPTPGPVVSAKANIAAPPPSRDPWIRGISKAQKLFGA